MCLNLKKTKETFEEHIEIAREDMVVYKVMGYKSRFFGMWKRFYAYYQEFVYKSNKVYRVIEFTYDTGCFTNYYEINKGFHAYLTKEIAENTPEYITGLDRYTDLKLVKCIIPKGTEYLKNDKEIVSKAIKVIKCLK